MQDKSKNTMENNMNVILFVNTLEQIGGTERMATLLANELAKRRYKVFMVCLHFCKKSAFEISSNIELLNLKQSRIKIIKFLYNVWSFRKIIKKLKNGLVINVGRQLIARSLPASIGLDFKILSWEHRDIRIDMAPLAKLSRRLISHYASKHILLSNTDVDYARNERNEINAVCIPNPITVSGNIMPSDLSNKAVLNVGRMSKEKGTDLLLAAWKLVIKKHPDWILQLVGNIEKNFSIEKNENIEIHPVTFSVNNFYQNASIYILPSRTECLPLAAIEAKAFGLPIISTNWGANAKELIDDSKNGFIVENFDIAKIAERINELIENESLRKQMGQASLESSEKYALDVIMDKWDKLLNEVLNAKN